MNQWVKNEITTGRINEHTHTILHRPFNQPENDVNSHQQPPVKTQKFNVLHALCWLRTYNNAYQYINILVTNFNRMINQPTLRGNCNNTIMSEPFSDVCVGTRVSIDTVNFEPRWGLFNGKRVPTHIMLVSFGRGHNIMKVVQTMGRATFNGKSILQNNHNLTLSIILVRSPAFSLLNT